jgi:hypothetical protein
MPSGAITEVHASCQWEESRCIVLEISRRRQRWDVEGSHESIRECSPKDCRRRQRDGSMRAKAPYYQEDGDEDATASDAHWNGDEDCDKDKQEHCEVCRVDQGKQMLVPADATGCRTLAHPLAVDCLALRVRFATSRFSSSREDRRRVTLRRAAANLQQSCAKIISLAHHSWKTPPPSQSTVQKSRSDDGQNKEIPRISRMTWLRHASPFLFLAFMLSRLSLPRATSSFFPSLLLKKFPFLAPLIQNPKDLPPA